MKLLLCLLLSLCAAIVAAESEPLSDDNRIINGMESIQHSWPSIAHLTRDGVSHQCGSTLINSQWVLSAGHCFNNAATPSRWRVTLGDHDRTVTTGTEQRFDVEKIIVHPSYVYGGVHLNDIALVKIKGTATMNSYVGVSPMPDGATGSFGGMTCKIVGWGYTSQTSGSVARLREASIYVYTDSACQSRYPDLTLNSASQLCIGASGDLTSNCYGDSGGPLMCFTGGQWYVAGISSWVRYNSCTGGGAYTKVSAFRGWIASVLASN